jgi:hyaluronan synthase
MIAAVVMTVAVIGLMGAFLGIQKAVQVTKNKTLGSNLAQEKGLLEPITVLVDSDTFITTPDTVERLLRPFSDAKIGGVTTLQLIDNPQTWVEKVSFWLEHARALSSMAAASLFRQVLCLPGRMYAVRTSLIENKMEELVHGTLRFLWWGPWQWKAGDDRFITNCILKAGYGSIMVPDAVVTTIAPDTLKKTSYMWTRWGRSSQAYTLRSPWLFRPCNWFAAFVTWGDMIITLSTVYIVAIHWPYSMLTGVRTDPWYEMLALALVGMIFTIVSRQFVHLYQFPRSWYILPAFMLMVTYGQFIRLWALITPNKIGTWATRGADEKGSSEESWELDTNSIRDIECKRKET